MAIILINTAFLATDHYNMSASLKRALDIGNVIFTCIFGCEMIIKIVGLTPRGYIEDRFNVFDAAVMCLSVLEYIIGGTSSVTVFRAFRLLRIFKLARSWTSLQRMLEIIYRSLPAVGNCSFVLLLFMFIYTILGMQVFGGQMRGERFDEVPRHNFDSFLWAFVTVFQVLTGENWNEVLYDGMRATHWTAAIYFVTCVTIGNYILLNLFQAILLQNFSSSQAAISSSGKDAGDGGDPGLTSAASQRAPSQENIWSNDGNGGKGGSAATDHPSRARRPTSPLLRGDSVFFFFLFFFLFFFFFFLFFFFFFFFFFFLGDE
jgi:hypothetical protein